MQIPEGPICQSCSMPMTTPEHFGTERDGSRSNEYCTYCYEKGEFTNPQMRMEDMVAYLAPNWGKWTQRLDLTEGEARSEISAILSELKRWRV
jgi:hypothetical protein